MPSGLEELLDEADTLVGGGEGGGAAAAQPRRAPGGLDAQPQAGGGKASSKVSSVMPVVVLKGGQVKVHPARAAPGGRAGGGGRGGAHGAHGGGSGGHLEAFSAAGDAGGGTPSDDASLVGGSPGSSPFRSPGRRASVGGSSPRRAGSVAAGDLATMAALRSQMSAVPEGVFLPTSPWVRLADALVAAVALYDVLTAPYLFALPPPRAPDAAFAALDYLGDAVAVVVALMHTRVAFVDTNGAKVTRPKALRRRWARTHLPYDLLATLPVELLALASAGSARGVSRLYHGLRLRRCARAWHFVRLADSNGARSGAALMARLMGYVLLFAHAIACGWLAVRNGGMRCEAAELGFGGDGSGGGGGDVGELLEGCYRGDTSSYFLYFHGLYTALLVLVGEDVRPLTLYEHAYALVLLLVGAGVYSLVLGQVTLVVSNMNVRRSEWQQKVRQMTDLGRALGLPEKMRHEAVTYLEYMGRHDRSPQAMALLKDLPDSLYIKISNWLHRGMVEKVPMFRGCKPGFISAIVSRLELAIFMEGQVIVSRGDVGHSMFFITRGAVQVMDSHGGILAVLQEGSHFGEVALLASVRRTATVRAVIATELYTLSSKDLVNALRDFPEEADKLHQIAIDRLEELSKTVGDESERAEAKQAGQRVRRKSIALSSRARRKSISEPIADAGQLALMMSEGKREGKGFGAALRAAHNPQSQAAGGARRASAEVAASLPSNTSTVADDEASNEAGAGSGPAPAGSAPAAVLTDDIAELSATVANIADKQDGLEQTLALLVDAVAELRDALVHDDGVID